MVEPVGNDERQQYLDRAENHQHEHAGEQQGPQQPRRVQHEDATVLQVPEQMGLIMLRDSIFDRRCPGGHQQDQSDAEQGGHHDGTRRRKRRTDHQAGDCRTDRRAETPGAQHLPRRWRPAGVRRAGSAAGSRCRPGRRTPRRYPVPQRPPPYARSAVRQQVRGAATTETTAVLTAATTMMMPRWLRRSAASPPTSTNATSPAPRQVATSDSDVGSLSSSMTCNAITTAHMPSAKIDSDTAAIRRRYSRNRNGASTRQPPGATGGWKSNCVLTYRWSRTHGRRVERFSPAAARSAFRWPAARTFAAGTASETCVRSR